MSNPTYAPKSALSTRELGAIPLEAPAPAAATTPSTEMTTLIEEKTTVATEVLLELAHPCESEESVRNTARVAMEAVLPELVQDVRRGALLEAIAELHERARAAREAHQHTTYIQYENTIEILSDLGR